MINVSFKKSYIIILFISAIAAFIVVKTTSNIIVNDKQNKFNITLIYNIQKKDSEQTKYVSEKIKEEIISKNDINVIDFDYFKCENTTDCKAKLVVKFQTNDLEQIYKSIVDEEKLGTIKIER